MRAKKLVTPKEYKQQEKYSEFIKPIPLDYGVGYRWKGPDGTLWESGSRTKHRVVLEISSFVGISIGAVHFYGHLGVWMNLERIRIELVRELRAEEIEEEEYARFCSRWYKPGDYTNCFDTREQILEEAAFVMKNYFPKGWVLYNGCTDEKVIFKRMKRR